MTYHQPVDREAELAQFDRMIAGQTAERILLVRAESGMGKTTLLTAFAERCPRDIVFVPVELKGIPSMPELFARVCDALEWARFHTLAGQIAQFVHGGSINVSDNTMALGRAQIDIQAAFHAPDEDTRQLRRTMLTDAFFADLRTVGRVVIVFDTFNACDALVKEWLGGAFLSRARRTHNLTVVIAGHHVPEPTIEWEAVSHQLSLGGITIVEYWLTYAQVIGSGAHPEFIKGCCVLYNGRPDEMIKAIHKFLPQERRA